MTARLLAVATAVAGVPLAATATMTGALAATATTTDGIKGIGSSG